MNTRRIFPILAACLFTVFSPAGCNTTSEVEVDKSRVPAEKVLEWIEKYPDRYLIVDARPEAAFLAGHIPGAVRMDPVQVDPEDPDPSLKKYKSIIVYGENPAFGRANALTKRLLEAGLSVNMLDGGLKAWREKDYPIESGEAGEP